MQMERIAFGGITGAALGYVASRDVRGVVAAGSLGVGLSMLLPNGKLSKDPMSLVVGLAFAGFGAYHGFTRPKLVAYTPPPPHPRETVGPPVRAPEMVVESAPAEIVAPEQVPA